MMELHLSRRAKNRNNILAVDDDTAYRHLLGMKLGSYGLRHVVVESADRATEVMLPETYTGVITDGLFGQWDKVVNAADHLGIRAVVLTADEDLVKDLVRQGQPAVYKVEDYAIETAIQVVLL